MKKLFLLILSAFAAFSLCAQEKTVVLCTTTPVGAFANAVLKDVPGMEVKVLLPPSVGCPHDYSVTPQDMKKLASAKYIVKNGLGLEGFLDRVVGQVNKKAVVVDASKGIDGKTLLENCSGHHHDCEKCGEHKEHAEEHKEHAEEHKEHAEEHKEHAEEHHHHHDGKYNEHIFASPVTAALMVESIAKQFAAADPANAKKYTDNAAAYSAKLRETAKKYALLKNSPALKEVNKVAAQHGIFDYMARDCGFEVEIYLQEHAAQEPSSAEVIKMVKEMKDEKIKFILAEKQYPAKLAAMTARAAGAGVLTLSMYPEAPCPDMMLAIFEDNASVLAKAFSRESGK